MRSYEEASKRKNRGREELTGVWPAVKERRRQVCRGRSNLPAMLRGEEAAAASSTMTPGVGERMRRRAGGRRRRSFLSVPRSGGEAQAAGEQKRKKALWRG
jgi:hypothetical protein